LADVSYSNVFIEVSGPDYKAARKMAAFVGNALTCFRQMLDITDSFTVGER
jgi:hypothetical protein